MKFSNSGHCVKYVLVIIFLMEKQYLGIQMPYWHVLHYSVGYLYSSY